MTSGRTSVAMTAATEEALVGHLDRDDGQEDICLATYRPSTGLTRVSAVIRTVVRPGPGDRHVHGNATITAEYILQAAVAAQDDDCGLVLLHSHPGARGWQRMSGPDRDCESSYAILVRELTGLPLVGMTLATGDRTWSARHWDIGVGRSVDCTHCANVRTVGERLAVSWNDEVRPAPSTKESHERTVSAWGAACQADLARRKVLVVGAGSVGLDVVLRLGASGLCDLTVMDFDVVEERNLDRLIGASGRDALMRRSKTHVAVREATAAATAEDFDIASSTWSICEPEGLRLALDHDLVFSCVDRNWPRAVLNALAYTDLIPVIDGGIAIDVLESGEMRNATWRSHVVRPGRPCMGCNGQVDFGAVALERQGLLDDPEYIKGSGRGSLGNANVAALSVNVAASVLGQYVSLSVAPAGLGDPGPLQYAFSVHNLARRDDRSSPHCMVEAAECEGDSRVCLTGIHEQAVRLRRRSETVEFGIRVLRWVDDTVQRITRWLDRRLG